jgi:hypothetical protein
LRWLNGRPSAGGGSDRLDAAHGADPIDGPVEGQDLLDPRALGASDQVGIRKVEPMDLVHLDRALQQRRVNDAHRRKGEDGAQRLGDLVAAAAPSRVG